MPLQQEATIERLHAFVSLAAAMRHLFICALLGILPITALAQTTRALPQPGQATGSELSTDSVQVSDWASRLMSNDPKVRAMAEDGLVQEAGRSLPLLKRLLDNEDLQLRTLEIIRRIGPPAIPLLVDLLRDERVSIRRSAAEAFIDLAPDTESIQPALRRALVDEDSDVAGDAARALGALGEKASPSVRALVEALSHEEPHVRIFAAGALGSIGPKAQAAREALRAAADDPALRGEAEWALKRIAGVASAEPVASPPVPALPVAPEPQTTAAHTGNPPAGRRPAVRRDR
jgi:hypothetical protein